MAVIHQFIGLITVFGKTPGNCLYADLFILGLVGNCFVKGGSIDCHVSAN